MQDEKTHGLTRRSFIKGAATLTAAGALVGCSPKAENLEEVEPKQEESKAQIFTGVCRGNCFGGCMMDIHVRDGQVVRTTAKDFPNPAYTRICSKGITQVARVYSAERLQYPMRRVGERGAGEFERISWEEAIGEISEKWQGYIDEYGPSSNGFFKGSGNFGMVSGGYSAGFMDRFTAVLGMSTVSHDVDMAAYWGSAKLRPALSDAGGNNEPADFLNSKVIINWAQNPTVSHPHIVHFMMEAQEKGAKLVVIDPVYNATAAKADWYIPINPSTDGVLALSIANEIIANGSEKADFVRDHTEAPLLIKEDGAFLRMSDLGVKPIEGDLDPQTGKPSIVDPYAVWDESVGSVVALEEAKTPSYKSAPSIDGIVVQTVWENLAENAAKYPADIAAEICGVSVEDIKELARIYIEDGPVNTVTSLGADHYMNGQYNYWAMGVPAAITGNYGKPGAALGSISVGPNSLLDFSVSVAPVDSEGKPAQGVGPSYNMNTLNDILSTGKFGTVDAVLKSLYIAAGNPATVWSDHSKTVEFFKNIEFLVVSDIAMTETAMYADILLPVAHWFEVVDLFGHSHNHPYLVWQEKASEPQFESKSDFDILKMIAENLGYGSFFDFNQEEYIRMAFDTDSARELGVTVDRLKEEHAVRMLPGEVFVSYEDGVLATPTGRAVFYKEDAAPSYNAGQKVDLGKERVLYWEPSNEADKNSPIRSQYPFHCISEHMRTRTHSQWYDVDYLREFDPEPIVRMNPDDAGGLGIVEGDMVRMYNDRGSVVMKATISAGYPRGVVGSPRSYQAKEYIEGHFASLSTNEYNQACANQAFNDVAVAIEKA